MKLTAAFVATAIAVSSVIQAVPIPGFGEQLAEGATDAKFLDLSKLGGDLTDSNVLDGQLQKLGSRQRQLHKSGSLKKTISTTFSTPENLEKELNVAKGLEANEKIMDYMRTLKRPEQDDEYSRLKSLYNANHEKLKTSEHFGNGHKLWHKSTDQKRRLKRLDESFKSQL